jgi:hypothetical protein
MIPREPDEVVDPDFEKDALKRAARLVSRVDANCPGGPGTVNLSGGPWTKAAVLRLAIARGLAALEAEDWFDPDDLEGVTGRLGDCNDNDGGEAKWYAMWDAIWAAHPVESARVFALYQEAMEHDTLARSHDKSAEQTSYLETRWKLKRAAHNERVEAEEKRQLACELEYQLESAWEARASATR